jgi:hypothetical protein
MIKDGGNGFDFDLETEVQFPRRNDRPGRAVIAKKPSIHRIHASP